ncbi:hypothetical protein DY000_02045799 [Brassica cretica]|uniref:Chlorophyll a-b binding protein, chloroplastic n=1 Tax=Brassica cretica TaxID=69181 RepID=A0ABQ7EP36_BRACR|nr:hypothetical protein DY000_02045799 [Brassica cretica]
MMLVRVQASTTRVEPTRVLLPASRHREEPTKSSNAAWRNEASTISRGFSDAGSHTRVGRGEADVLTRDEATWIRLPARMKKEARRPSDAGGVTRGMPSRFNPSQDLSLVEF